MHVNQSITEFDICFKRCVVGVRGIQTNIILSLRMSEKAAQFVVLSVVVGRSGGALRNAKVYKYLIGLVRVWTVNHNDL